MTKPRPQANDNHSPEDLCGLRIDEMKRQLVAKITCAARRVQPSPSEPVRTSERYFSRPTVDL
ncbi:hypothetical protein KXR53_19250 [Inquilinus limosus]|uniref:hypothetical protein n=1 Tax=Inquilinus limosus TaxID=171674 RepID=UPI003F13C7CE